MKLEINIPESLDDITLEQYQNYLLIEEPNNEDLLSIFLNLNKQGVSKIKDSEVDRMVLLINSLFETNQELQRTFSFRGEEFGFVPNLDNISYGENKDITTYVSDWEQMHKAMAVLYRPIEQKRKGKYTIKEYNGTTEYSEAMKQMPLSVVMGSMVFFYNLTKELLNYIPNYLEEETMRGLTKGQISVENGVAIKKSIRSLKATLGELKKLQDFPYINA